MDDEPIGTPHRRCKATAKSTGERCKRYSGSSPTCRVHGGAARQVKRKAAERARQEKAQQACEALGVPVETDAAAALQDELNRTYGHVVWLRRKVASLGEDALAWDRTEPAWWQLYAQERDRLVTVCKVMLSADVQGRLVAVAKETAEQFHQVLSAILDALNLTEAQREMVPEVVPRVMRLLIAQDTDGDGAA